jgi:hypothetical protein
MPSWGELPILQDATLISTVEKFRNPDFVAQNEIFTTRVPLDGPVAEWDVLGWARKKAGFVSYDSPAQQVEVMPVDHQSARVAKVFLKKELDGNTLAWLREPGTEHGQAAEAKIARELEDLNRQVDYLVEYACWQALTGALTISQSAADSPMQQVQFTVDYGLAASHAFAITTADNDWDETEAPILTDGTDGLPAIQRLTREDAGLELARCFTNETVQSDLLNNTQVKGFFGERLKNELLERGYIRQMRGIAFRQYDFGYVDAAGTFHKFIADQRAIFLPAANEYFEMHEAPAMVPDGQGGLKRVPGGKYAYAQVQYDPPGVTLFVGYNFLPVCRFPDAWVYANVKST